jgi:hypothetical protein
MTDFWGYNNVSFNSQFSYPISKDGTLPTLVCMMLFLDRMQYESDKHILSNLRY